MSSQRKSQRQRFFLRHENIFGCSEKDIQMMKYKSYKCAVDNQNMEQR
jgi:hypothetical protein